MCSIMAGLAAASTLMGAYGQIQQSKAQASAARAQADAAEKNARIENKKQEMIADQYAQEDLRRRAQARLNAGANRANAGAAGLNIGGSSSVLDILTSSEEAYRNDQYNSLVNQRTDNWVSRQQEANYLTQASSYRAQADNAERAGNIAALSTILGGATSIYGSIKGSGSSTKTSTYSQPSKTNTKGKMPPSKYSY